MFDIVRWLYLDFYPIILVAVLLSVTLASMQLNSVTKRLSRENADLRRLLDNMRECNHYQGLHTKLKIDALCRHFGVRFLTASKEGIITYQVLDSRDISDVQKGE